MSMFGIKIIDNATAKYSTTINAAWNVYFVGFNDKNISKTGENGG
jgi:hypothetical protein